MITSLPDGLATICLSILEEEVRPAYPFHGGEHTARVMRAVETLAEREVLEPEEAILAMTAALLHDLGYRESRQGHERRGAELANQLLPVQGYSLFQIDRIRELIMATADPEPSPGTLLAKVFLDACWEFAGAPDGLDQILALGEEQVADGMATDHVAFLESMLRILDRHAYHTATAATLFEPEKRRTVYRLERRLRDLREGDA
jgi:uncharacterized protein